VNIATAVILLLALALAGYAFIPFKKNIMSMRKGDKPKKKEKATPLHDLNLLIKHLEKQINTLNSSLGDRIAKAEIKLNQMEGKINELRKEIEAAKHLLPGTSDLPNEKPLPEESKLEKPPDGRIWVEKTGEGAKKMIPSDTKRDLFLLQDGDVYLLHIPMDPGNYHNLLTLYKDIIDFPFQAGTVNEMIMRSHPQYRKQDDCFVFVKKGDITVK